MDHKHSALKGLHDTHLKNLNEQTNVFYGEIWKRHAHCVTIFQLEQMLECSYY